MRRLDRQAIARRALDELAIDAPIHVTRAGGEAHAIANQAANDGVDTVVAWGGDGTVNEIARALAFTNTALAIVPGGSGNGLARELAIQFKPEAGLRQALTGSLRRIDVGEIAGRLFFNVAGIGLDARVATRALTVRVRRGFTTYMLAMWRELLRRAPIEYDILADGRALHGHALVIALANSRQYGYKTQVAPGARLDDGELQLVIVDNRSFIGNARRLPFVFTDAFDRQPGVTTLPLREGTFRFQRAVPLHVDGEPMEADPSFIARVHPGALSVRI